MQLQKLKGYLKEKNKTYADCAEALGISITSFSSKINGKSNFDIVEVNKLVKFLEMPIYIAIEIFLP